MKGGWRYFPLSLAFIFIAVIPILFPSLNIWITSRGPSRFGALSEPFVPLANDTSIPSRPPQIPNSVHFVYILSDPSDDFAFPFSHYLSIYAAWFYWKPTGLYIHTNADDEALDRARRGSSGKWDQLIFNMPGLMVRRESVPTHAGNGVRIEAMEHKSDFVRVKVIEELGGIYIDWDVHALRDISPLRCSGFNAVGGREFGGRLNSGTFMSKAHSRMITLWGEGMSREYNGEWTTHSNGVLTEVGNRLIKEPHEMLVMEREAFAPWSWTTVDGRDLYGIQDVKSNLEGISQGDALPEHSERGVEGRNRDWSKMYMLHAFNPNRWGQEHLKEVNDITPRYVLERRSNFARAVYPVARDMYEKGHIMIDD